VCCDRQHGQELPGERRLEAIFRLSAYNATGWRQGRRRRRSLREVAEELPHDASTGRDPVTPGIHALLEADIVASLELRRAAFGCTGSRESAERQPAACSDRRSPPAVDCRSRRCAKQSPERRGTRPAVNSGTVRRPAAHLFGSELPAHFVVNPKLLKTFSRPGKHHDARLVRWNGCATRDEKEGRATSKLRSAMATPV
jgi:hypothetical protein